MKIAIVASDYYPTVGGVQTAVRNIAHHATVIGHSVLILSSLPQGDVAVRDLVDDIPVHRFPWGRRPLVTLPFRALVTLIGMARAIKAFQPDVVYIHFLSINALYVLLLHYVMRFRLIASARGNDIQGIPARSRGQRWMLKRLFARANAILFCSSFVQRDAAPYLKYASPRAFVGVAGDGCNLEEFQGIEPYTFSEPYLLAMGRLVHKKGFDLLIEAFSHIVTEFPRVHLTIAGDGEERANLERLIERLEMRERVHLFGFADRATTIALFLGCEFFVLSSRLEPFGIVVLEAMAARKAVLATRSGGVVDLVQPGVNGRLIEPTCEQLVIGMREMLRNPEETRLLGYQAARTVEKHTWAAVTRVFLDVFARTVEERA